MAIVAGMATILIGGLIALWARSAPVAQPFAEAPAAPASAAPRPHTSNRLFLDEIAAAQSALDLGDPATRVLPWPERVSAPITPAVALRTLVAQAARPRTSNHLFLDEIAGAQAQSGWAYLPTTDVIILRSGPR
jgi:hypothetical protein